MEHKFQKGIFFAVILIQQYFLVIGEPDLTDFYSQSKWPMDYGWAGYYNAEPHAKGGGGGKGKEILFCRLSVSHTSYVHYQISL